MSEPIQFHPIRTEPRGAFPVHSESPPGNHYPLTRAEALDIALRRLADWVREHHEREEAEQYGEQL